MFGGQGNNLPILQLTQVGDRQQAVETLNRRVGTQD